MIRIPIPSDLSEEWHTLVVEVDADKGIRSILDDKHEIEWRGEFNPVCVCISGDEFVDWYIDRLKFYPLEKSTAKEKSRPTAATDDNESEKHDF